MALTDNFVKSCLYYHKALPIINETNDDLFLKNLKLMVKSLDSMGMGLVELPNSNKGILA